MNLEDLEIYKLAIDVSDDAWRVYKILSWPDKKIMGDQFVSAVDSIGASIAEGFGRFHYLDKNKFNYNARGSLLESLHWLEVLSKRGKIKEEIKESLKSKLYSLHRKLNGYINITKKQVEVGVKTTR